MARTRKPDTEPAADQQTQTGEQALPSATDNAINAEADAAAPPAVPAKVTPAEMTPPELARAVLDRTIRPLAAHVRILAEAVLAAENTGKKAKKVKAEPASSKKKKHASKKAKAKLAKIPKTKSSRKAGRKSSEKPAG